MSECTHDEKQKACELGICKPTPHALTREQVIKQLVNKFLAWPLPESVCSDLCATKQGYPHRSGTTLLTATEAKQMFEHVLTELFEALSQQAQEVTKQKEAKRTLTETILRCFGWEVNVDSCGTDGTVYRRKGWRDSTRSVVYAYMISEIIEVEAQEVERIQKELDHHVRQRCYVTEENLKLKQEVERYLDRIKELKGHRDKAQDNLEQTQHQLAAMTAERERDIDKLKADLNEMWVDDKGTVWTKPTAWAYAMVCKSRETARQDAARLRELLAISKCGTCDGSGWYQDTDPMTGGSVQAQCRYCFNKSSWR